MSLPRKITERKRIEADLAANQAELRSINIALAERVAVQAQERDRIWNLAQDLFVVSDSSVAYNTRLVPGRFGWQNRRVAPTSGRPRTFICRTR